MFNNMTLVSYVPQDRLRAMVRGEMLPDRTSGSALFADISGFTPLTEALHDLYGPRRGAEELTRHLDAVYTSLITQVEKYGGSVIDFAGDAIMCWFDAKCAGRSGKNEIDASSDVLYSPSCAVACAFALQEAVRGLEVIRLPDGTTTTIALKVTIATGAARRLVVGDPAIQNLDTIAGATITRTGAAEHLSQKGDVLTDEATAEALGAALKIREWRQDTHTLERFAAIESYDDSVIRGWALAREHETDDDLSKMDSALVRPYIIPAVFERETTGQGAFLTEFRPCAVLFVRFSGIDYDAERAQEELDAFVRRAQEIVARSEGTILQLTIGDKGSYLLINLGALSAHEDDVRRAIKIALELRENPGLPPGAALYIGLAQGVMCVGAYGGPRRRTYGAQGDDVNLAARLMQTAAAGEILVSGRAQQAVEGAFTFEPRAPLELKGKAEPVPVFAVTGERRQRAIRLQEPTYALPMVGRQGELEIVNEKLEKALAGNAQVIGIVADAGMGKSRLVAEVIRLARRKGFTGYGGACQSDAISTPYQAWKSIWGAFFGVDPDHPLRKQIRSLEEEIQDRAPERAQALPLLGVVLNLTIPDNDFTRTLEPKYRQSALHALLQDCLRADARDEPILIVIEDVHWMDALSYELLEETARTLNDSRVCFVLAYRPAQLRGEVASRLENLPHFTKIELRELDAREAAQAIRAKLAQLYPARGGAVPPALVEKLLARAQGNPFYLEELLNFLRDRGLDPRDPNDMDRIELPDSLHALILSRIDRLSEHEKTTLRVASIIGRLFRTEWLTGYFPELGELPLVKSDLEELAELEITLPESPEPDLTYLFKHIVTHQVTYESLPFATRALLHERLAEYLEKQIAAGTLSELFVLDTLVYHYAHSENRAKLRKYLGMAAQAALEVSAFKTAVEYLARLAELVPNDNPAHAALALQLADALYQLNDFPAARAAIRKAQSAATTDAEHAAALTLQIEMASLLGEYTEAQTLLSQAVPLARASGDAVTLCRALYALGDLNWRMGKFDDARRALDESLALARQAGEVNRELFALNRLALVLGLQGDLDENERMLAEVHTRAVATGNREREMTALNNLGVVAVDREDYAAAREYTVKAIHLAREIGVQDVISLGLLNLADIDIQLGQLAEGRAELHEGLKVALALDARPRMVQALKTSAYLAHMQGENERALELWGLARRQPAWTGEDQYDMDKSLARWALDPTLVEEGLEKGGDLDWDKTLEGLVKE